MVDQPVQTVTRGADHRRVCSNIHTGHTCCTEESAEVGNRGEVLITGSADELDPGALGQALIRT